MRDTQAMTSKLFTREERLNHANDLIRIISDHGRRFFFDKKSQRVAKMQFDARGRIWFVDDHSDKAVYVYRSGFGNSWNGFTHGGTLRSLVEALRDYIVSGERLSLEYIAPERLIAGSNIWGYSADAAKAVREAVYKLPIIQKSMDA